MAGKLINHVLCVDRAGGVARRCDTGGRTDDESREIVEMFMLKKICRRKHLVRCHLVSPKCKHKSMVCSMRFPLPISMRKMIFPFCGKC